MKLVIICMTALIFTCSGNLHTQNYQASIQHYGIEEGLSHNQTLSTFRDSRGIMWFLAKDQLNRFDGHEFVPIPATVLRFDSNARILLEDAEGDLWIRQGPPPSGLIFFNIHRNTLQTVTEKFQGTPLAEWDQFTGVLPFSQGVLLTKPDGEVWHWTSQRATTFGKMPPHWFCEGVGQTNKGQYWWIIRGSAAKQQRLLLQAKDGKVLGDYALGPALVGRSVLSNGSIIYLHDNQLIELAPDGQSTIRPIAVDIPANDTLDFGHRHLLYDELNGQVWYQSKNRLLVLTRSGELLYDFVKTHPELQIINVYQLRQSDDGKVWLSSIEGAYRLGLSRTLFQRWLWQDPDITPSSDLISCRGIATGKDGYCVAAGGGSLWLKQAEQTTALHRLHAYHYLAVEPDGDGGYWAAAPDTIVHWQLQEGLRKWSIVEGGVLCMDQDDDRLWLGVDANPAYGLAYFDTNTEQLVPIPDHALQAPGEHTLIRQVIPLGRDSLWLVSAKGLFLYDLHHGILAHYSEQATGPHTLGATYFYHVHIDTADIWWLASRKGLLRWDPKSGAQRLFTTSDGLSHNNIYAVYEDDYGYLWLSSDYGIMQFEKQSERVRTYLPNEGVSHMEFNSLSHSQAPDGRLYFGSLNGVTHFHPRDFRDAFEQTWDIPLVLTDCEITKQTFGSARSALPDLRADIPIRLYHDDRALRLRFALLEYNNNQLVQYAYRIAGYTDDWQVTKSNTLLLGGLPYGTHLLEVKGRTGHGPYSNAVLRIPIEVIRPWYQSYWTYIAVVLALIFLSWQALNWRTRQLANRNRHLAEKVTERTALITRQKRELEELDEVKSRFFANVAHELRTPLTLIQGPLQSVLKESNITERQDYLLNKARNNTKHLLELVDEIMELTRIDAKQMKVNPEPVHLYTFVQQLSGQFYSLGYANRQHLKVDYELDEQQRLLLDHAKLRKVLNNLLFNAYRFTPPGRGIQLRVAKINQRLLLEVADEGRGIPAEGIKRIFERFYQANNHLGAEGGTGIGLAVCKELVKIMGGDIEVESEVNVGTTFRVYLPWEAAKTQKEEPKFAEEVHYLGTRSASAYINATTPAPPTGAPFILVAEDHPELSDYLRYVLSSKFNTMIVGNGLEAIDYLSKVLGEEDKTLPDLLLTDLMMPIMDGYELVKALKHRPDFQHLPILVLTARAERDARLQSLRIGVDDYLLKPFDEEELVVRIQNLLTNAKNRQQAQAPEPIREIEHDKVEEESILLSNEDQQWLSEVETACLARLTGPSFTLEDLARDFHTSRSSFFRRLKNVTGLSPTQYLREVRLQHARQLLETRQVSLVQEAAQQAGFSKSSYFSRLYRERFGKSPADELR